MFKNLDYGTYYVAETDEFGGAITSGMFIESNEIVNGEVELTPKNATAKSKIINHVVDFPDNFYKVIGRSDGSHKESGFQATEKQIR